jgi:hypothetical protein
VAERAVQSGLGNYTFLTSGASVRRTNVYEVPESPFLRWFSNNQTHRVFLCGLTLPPTSPEYIKATVPTGATTGYVTVTKPSGTLTSNVPFHVIK